MPHPQSVLVDRRRQAELGAKGWTLDRASGYQNMCWMTPPADDPEGDLRPISEVIANWGNR